MDRLKMDPLSQRRTPGPELVIPADYHPPTSAQELSERAAAGETMLVMAKVNGETFSNVHLGNVNLHQGTFDGCTFENCTFDQTVFSGASFQRATFSQTQAAHCIMLGTDFFGATIGASSLTFCDLKGACFVRTKFLQSILIGNSFQGAWFSFTEFLRTPFSLNDLSNTEHPAPQICFIDIVSLDLSARILEPHFAQVYDDPDLQRRQRGLVESQENVRGFLSRCGAPPDAFNYYQAVVRSSSYESVFLSYSTKDEEFARELHSELRKQGIDVWFAPHDIQGGRTILDQVTRAINEKGRVILVLSESSMNSGWVRTEIRHTMRTKPGIAKLFPIGLVAYEQIRRWELFDPDTGEDLALHIRGFFIPDFCEWRIPERFASSLDRLTRALKTAIE